MSGPLPEGPHSRKREYTHTHSSPRHTEVKGVTDLNALRSSNGKMRKNAKILNFNNHHV